MDTTITVKDHKKQKQSRHAFTVEVPAIAMAGYFEAAYKKLAPSVEIKGFRPGAAPKLMTIQRIGQDRYFQTALDLALPDSYALACQQLEIRPVAPPEIAIQGYGEGAPLTFTVAVDVIPDVDPGQYSKVKVKTSEPDTAVKVAEVNEVLERLRKQQATVVVVDRAAKLGDRVEVDYVGMVKGVKRDDLSSQHHPVILGDKILTPKLEEAIVGHTKGDTFSVSDKIKDDTVEFTVIIHDVYEITLPEIDTKFAEQFGRKSADDLKTAIEDQLKSEKVDAERRELEGKVLEAVLAKATLDVPRSLVEEEITRRLNSVQQQFGAMLGKLLESQKKTENDLRKEFEPEAEQSVKLGLLLGEIAKRENFGADRTKDEDDAAFQRRVVRRTINFLVASATGIKEDDSHLSSRT